MRKILVSLLLVVVSVVVVWASADIPATNYPAWIPDGRKTISLTAPQLVWDHTTWRGVRITSSVDCIRRSLPLANASRSQYPAVKIYADTPDIIGIHAATPFLNLSGCVGTKEGM